MEKLICMKIHRKIKLLGIFTYENKIVLRIPKIDNELVNFLEGIHMDIGFPLETFDYDTTFNLIKDQYFTTKWNNYEIDLFIDDTYLFMVIRYPEGEMERIMKIIHNYTFFPDENTKGALIKIESDDTQNQDAVENEK